MAGTLIDELESHITDNLYKFTKDERSKVVEFISRLRDGRDVQSLLSE